MARDKWLGSFRRSGRMTLVLLAVITALAVWRWSENDTVYAPVLIGAVVGLLAIAATLDAIACQIELGREKDTAADRRSAMLAEVRKIASDIQDLESLRADLLRALAKRDDNGPKA